MAARWGAAALCAMLAPVASAQFIQNQLPEPARGLDVVERVGEAVPLDIDLVNDDGKTVKLGDYFNRDKPVVLALAYYDCTLACPTVFDAMARGFNDLSFTIGRDFNVVVVSFNPKDTTVKAAKAKATVLPGYNRSRAPGVESGWEFHTATAAASKALADAVGFSYRYLPDVDQYSHPVGIFILTPAGKISRYLYGFEFPSKDMKLALMEASEGKMARTIGDRFLQFCYHYNPKTGTYTLAAHRLMQAGALVTLFLLVGLVALLKASEARRKRAAAAGRLVPALPDACPSASPLVAPQR